MTVSLKELPVGARVASENGGAEPDLVEVLQRLVRAVREAQTAPVYGNAGGPILTSPDGTQYRLTVDNAGNLGTTAV